MSKYDDRKAELQKALVAATTPDQSIADEARRAAAVTAAVAGVKAKLKKLDDVTNAVKVIDDTMNQVADMLADADDTLADEVRIAAMNKLRAAINTLHEAG